MRVRARAEQQGTANLPWQWCFCATNPSCLIYFLTETDRKGKEKGVREGYLLGVKRGGEGMEMFLERKKHAVKYEFGGR